VKRFAPKSVLWSLGLLLATPFVAAGTGETTSPTPSLWWRDAAFYQIFVRSFADATSGPLAADGIGDLQGLIDKLDYLNDGDPATTTDLGVSAIWLLPINPSPSYHGYDVSDYFAVNPQYGDVALFKKLIAEAHRRGIRVIIDLVLNHASSQHPWFKEALREESPPATGSKRDLFIFAPAARQNAGPWGERCWHYAEGEFYYGLFDSGMPDWNFRNPAVTKHHRAVAKFWLQDVGVDGFRLDAIRYLFEHNDSLQDLSETKRWLRQFTDYCHELKPDAFLVGEVWADTEQAASYVSAGSVDTDFEFDLAKSFIEAASFSSPSLVTRRLERTRAAYGTLPWATFLANHDQERTLSQLGGDRAKAALAAALQFTAPGIPFIYYGEEIGMSGKKPDPDLRTPLQWSDAPQAGFTTGTPWHALNSDYPKVNIAAESADPDSLLSLYRRLVRLRATSPALRSGTPVAGFAFDGRGLYADLRESPSDIVLVLANTSERPRDKWALTLPDRVTALGAPSLLFSTAPLPSPAVPGRAGFALPPQSVALFQWRKP
jgi:alpha-amylase